MEGTCTRSDVHTEELIHRGNIHMKKQPNKKTYTRRRPHGGDSIRRGYYTKGICTWRKHTLRIWSLCLNLTTQVVGNTGNFHQVQEFNF